MGVSGQHHVPAALYPGEITPGTHWIGGWVGPRAGVDAGARRKILCLCRGSKSSRPVRSQTLYWLSYPGSSKLLQPIANDSDFKRSFIECLWNIINPLKLTGNYMYQLLWQSLTLYFVFMGFVWFSVQTAIISLTAFTNWSLQRWSAVFSLLYALNS
jgi:hypothetical protein